MMQPQAPLLCERHGALAGWECTVCHRALCPDCAALRAIPPVTLLTCGRCGELAEPLLRHKKDSATLAQRLPGAFLFPFRGEGLPAWLGIAMWLWATSWLGGLGIAIGWGATMASFFGLTRSTARGGEHLELSDFQDPLHSVAAPLARFAVAMVPAWAGAGLAFWLDSGWLWWVTAFLTALWSPTAFIGAAASVSVVHLLNPLRVLGTTARIGKDFGVYLGALGLVALVMVLAVPLSMLVGKLWAPVVAGVAAQMVLIYAPLVAARIAGLVLLLHGPIFGWGDEGEAYEPVLGPAQPTGLPYERERTLPNHLPSAIELNAQAPAQTTPELNRFAALEVNPRAKLPPAVAPLDVALLPSISEQSAQAIRTAIEASQIQAALDGFRSAGQVAAPALTAHELLWLGQSATAHIDYESAELAFTKAAERPGPASEQGRARVMLARLLAERLNRRDEADTWMRRVIAEQPQTPAAEYALKWLQSSPSPCEAGRGA